MMSRNITINNVVVQKIGLDSTDLNSEIVMMDITAGRYYCINSVGSRIWKIIEEPNSVNKIISILIEEFEVEPKVCEEAVLDFLNKAYDEDIITVN